MKSKKRISLRVANPRELEFFGKQYLEKPELQLFTYDAEAYNEVENYVLPDTVLKLAPEKISWLNVHGIHDIELINNLCNGINMPRFVIQDIIDINQRTKLQDLDDYAFFSIKSILPGDLHEFEVEQISFILGKNQLFSFQEKKGDHFQHVRVRIRENHGLVRKKGADFLLFLLLEGVLENYFTTVEAMDERIKDTVNPIPASDPNPQIVLKLEELKRKLQKIKKNIVSLKDALLSVEKGITPHIHEAQMKYYVDLKENCLYILDNISSMELRLDAAENLFFSIQGHRMNQVMTTLTILAAIFIPLTFMAGIYGMNFENMPELGWRYGYFGLLGLMAVVTLLMLLYFKRRKWF